MDQSRIDAFTRFVAQRTGRRTVSTGVLGGLLATLVPGFGTLDTGARPKRRKAKKPPCKKAKRRCGKTCVNVKTSRQHCGKCDRKCQKPRTCRQGKCILPCGKGGPCRVFVTSSRHTGNLGGLAGADRTCTNLAHSAGLPGRYKAWLSTDAASPLTRFRLSTGPYVLPNGTRIANNWADLTDGTLRAPINIMENGRPADTTVPGGPYAWTRTETSGARSSDTVHDCQDWTTGSSAGILGNYGYIEQTGTFWTATFSSTCSSTHRLYCFQQS